MIYAIIYLVKNTHSKAGLYLQWAKHKDEALSLAQKNCRHAKDPNMFVAFVFPMNTIKTIIGIFLKRKLIV